MSGVAATSSTATTSAVVSKSTVGRRAGQRVLSWAFTLFNSLRLLAYLPTTWAIYSTGDSSQHSLWTWGVWLGANATMAAWLYEHNSQRLDKAVLVNVGNAAMCLATAVVILCQRM
jgi:hypothetical protein